MSVPLADAPLAIDYSRRVPRYLPPGGDPQDLAGPPWSEGRLSDLLDTVLKIDPGPPPDELLDHIDASFRRKFRETGESFKRKVVQYHPKAPIVVVVPAAMPPVARRQIPLLLGNPLSGRKHRDRSPLPDKTHALEAPVALAIQATRDLPRPPSGVPLGLLIKTGDDAAGELTAMTIDFRAGELAIQLHGVRPWPGPAPTLPTTVTPDAWRVVHTGPLPRELAALAGPDSDRVHKLDDDAVLHGAIRYALVRSKRPVDGLRSIEIHSACTAPVGLLGRNTNREWYWHRLVPAGGPLPHAPRELDADAPARARTVEVALAECLNPEDSHLDWIHQEDWSNDKARLRWHDVAVAVPRLGSTHWTFRPSDSPGHRVLKWDVTYPA